MIASSPAGLRRYERDGAAPAVLFVHGSMDRAASFIRVQKHLGDRRTVRYDRRGYARSRSLDASGGLEAHISDLRTLLTREHAPAVVVGHSFGGLIALAAAQQVPELVHAVVCFEAPMAWVPWWPRRNQLRPGADPADVAEGFMRRMVGDDVWRRLPQRVREDRRAEGAALVAEMTSVHADEPPVDLSSVSCEAICAYGTDSGEHLQRASRELAAALPAGGLHVIEGAGHGAHVSHPVAFAELVRFALDRG